MRGSQLTERKAGLWNSISQSNQFKMLLASISVGVIAGTFMGNVHMNWGLPGHKALFWMAPVLFTRIIGRCKAGSTAGAMAAALTTFSFGGHIAGGVVGLPLVALVGLSLDMLINQLESRKVSPLAATPILTAAATLGNLVMLGKRILTPRGFGALHHNLMGITDPLYSLLSYAFFGLISGLAAATVAYIIISRKKQARKASHTRIESIRTIERD